MHKEDVVSGLQIRAGSLLLQTAHQHILRLPRRAKFLQCIAKGTDTTFECETPDTKLLKSCHQLVFEGVPLTIHQALRGRVILFDVLQAIYDVSDLGPVHSEALQKLRIQPLSPYI
jgi:hypothetical protein